MNGSSRDHEQSSGSALNSNGLRPCPFCGESEELYPGHHWPGGGKPYAIDCLGCGIDFVPREGADVIAAWNKRAPSSAAQVAGDSSRDEVKPYEAEVGERQP